MVYGLIGQLAFSSAARRNTVLSDIQTRIATRPRWGIDVLEARSDLKVGPNGIFVSLRFVSRADQEDVQTRLESFATGQRAPVTGSWLALHDCSHDELEPTPCVEIARRTW